MKTTKTNKTKNFSSIELFDSIPRYLLKKECLHKASYSKSEKAVTLFYDVAMSAYADLHKTDTEILCDTVASDIAIELRDIIADVLIENKVKNFGDIFGEDAKKVTFQKPRKSTIKFGEKVALKEVTLSLGAYISYLVTKHFEKRVADLRFEDIDALSVNANGEEFTIYEVKELDSIFDDVYFVNKDFVNNYSFDFELSEVIDTLAVKYNLTLTEKAALEGYTMKLSFSAIDRYFESKGLKATKNTKTIKGYISKAFEKIRPFTFDYLKNAI